MGDIGVAYGFYGPEWDATDSANAKMEAGEAIVIADKDETWMWHILPDDTVSQSVPTSQSVSQSIVICSAKERDICVSCYLSSSLYVSPSFFSSLIEFFLFTPATFRVI